MKSKIKSRVLTISMIMVLIIIIFIGVYIYLSINRKLPFTANDTYETKLLDSYNYQSDYSTVIKNSNQHILEQFAKLDNNSNCISQITIQGMMYNIAHKNGRKINTIFKTYDNGYKNFDSSNRLFDNLTIFYANEKPFTLQYVNNIVNTEINEKLNLFNADKNVEDASAIGVYYKDIEFDEETTSSLMNTILLQGMHFVATTPHFDVIKVALKDNKTAILVTNNGTEENITYKQYISELKDIDSLTFVPRDIKIEVYPFKKVTSGIPGAILTDMKENMIDWDEKFNNLLVANYITCENKNPISTTSDSSDSSEFIEDTEELEDTEDTQDNYTFVYVLNNNYLMLIQDNNTKLIECICDLTE